jgi:hypothetical protein
MKKLLFVLIAGTMLAGCMSANSMYDGSEPTRTVGNNDGVTMFEFVYPASGFNPEKALQRIDEYCVRHSRENGLSAYEVLTVDYSNHEDITNPDTRYTHVLVQVRFRSERAGSEVKERTS